MEDEKEEVIDQYGFNEKHLYVNEDGTQTKFNPYGFDYLHRYKGKDSLLSDEFGFNFYGVNKVTGKAYDKHGFDRDGFYYEINGEECTKTDKKLNNEQFDREGFYYTLEGEEYVKTSYKTNPEGKDINGIFHEDGVRDPEILKEIQKKKEEQQRLKANEAEEKQRKLENRKRLADEFSKKFDENGICKTTGLVYDENYFKKDRTNVITGNSYDIRKFDFIGTCRDTDYKDYDRGRFRQDGTHIDTGEKYYKGYNAFGVDINGVMRNGKTPEEILEGKEYLKAIFEPTKTLNRATYLKNYAIRKGHSVQASILELDRILFTACEMLPSLKDELQKYMQSTSEKLYYYKKALESKKIEENANQETIEKLELAIKNLEGRIKAVGYSGGMQK